MIALGIGIRIEVALAALHLGEDIQGPDMDILLEMGHDGHHAVVILMAAYEYHRVPARGRKAPHPAPGKEYPGHSTAGAE